MKTKAKPTKPKPAFIVESPHPEVQKLEAFIQKYAEDYSCKPLHLGISAILKDDDYWLLDANQKAVFALLMTARAG